MKNVRSYWKLTVIYGNLLVMLMTMSPAIFRMEAISDPVVSRRWASYVESSLAERHPPLDALREKLCCITAEGFINLEESLKTQKNPIGLESARKETLLKFISPFVREDQKDFWFWKDD
ncbi:hypothetical protein ZHAS_00012538 [Anopheles sinensis]|uniref:Uncharacterized protein n=1 Tax=Anopheles sinensis TaxID=74873 RepID=A0A084W356_ANOSI|nr:hypothetical protein ZHAS_00012538 [Anopheles sinensis]